MTPPSPPASSRRTRCGTCASDHPRPGRGTEHQARHFTAGSAIRDFVASTDAALQRPARHPLVNFGHLGDGNLHYNVQCWKATMRRVPPARGRGQQIVYDAVGSATSISAEHASAG
jgi:hypothetical protein